MGPTSTSLSERARLLAPDRAFLCQRSLTFCHGEPPGAAPAPRTVGARQPSAPSCGQGAAGPGGAPSGGRLGTLNSLGPQEEAGWVGKKLNKLKGDRPGVDPGILRRGAKSCWAFLGAGLRSSPGAWGASPLGRRAGGQVLDSFGISFPAHMMGRAWGFCTCPGVLFHVP